MSFHPSTTEDTPILTANVDQQEIAKFAASAAYWWDKEGEFKPLHRINPLRLQYVLQRADGLFGKQVLDVGCGGGILTESLALSGAQVTGLDMAEESLQVARLHALENQLSIEYLQHPVEQHAADYPEHYDIVTCMEMLEHVPDPQSVVQACVRLVKPGGDLFFSTLNRNLKSWLFAIIGAEYLLNIVPRGTHDSKKFIKPAELIQWLGHDTVQEQHIIGLHYNPLRDRFSLGTNVDVNYLLHAQKIATS